MFEFVRAADKFIEEWDGEQRPPVLGVWLEKMILVGPPKKVFIQHLKVLRIRYKKYGADHFKFADAAAEFIELFLKFRMFYEVKIENDRLKVMLELCWPLLAARAEARGFKSDNPLMLSNTVKKAIEEKSTGIFNELKGYRTLAAMLEQFAINQSKGKKSPKLLKQIKMLRKKLKHGYNVKGTNKTS